MKIFYGLITAFFMLILMGCSEQEEQRAMPQVLTIGILPDEDKTALLKRYTPLFEYLSEKLGVSYSLMVPADYADLLSDFETGKIDLAYFGGFTFVQASEKFNAVPLVMRDIDMRFTSYFLTSRDSPAKSIAEFKNKRFSFGSRLSTSGHLMPRYFLQQDGFVPELVFSEITYSGSHDETAYRVRDGDVDLGVANAKIIDTMFKDGRISRDDLRILEITPPYTDYVWAMQADFTPMVRTKVIDAFLSLTPDQVNHRKILSAIDAGGFIPASIDDFAVLKKIIQGTTLNNTESGK